MDKNTALQLTAIGAAALVSVAVKLFAPQPTSIFGFSQPEPSPIIKMPDSAEVAKEKSAAVKNLINSEAFVKALPSAQKQMLQGLNDLFN